MVGTYLVIIIKKFSIKDNDETYYNNSVTDNLNLEKLKIAWNIGVGIFPLNKINLFDKNYFFLEEL